MHRHDSDKLTKFSRQSEIPISTQLFSLQGMMGSDFSKMAAESGE